MNKTSRCRELLKTVGVLLTGLVAFSGSSSAQLIKGGNVFDIGTSSNTATVNTANNQWVTFTATGNDAISDVRVYNSTAPTGSPLVTVGLYAVDGAGKPTGAALATNSFSPTGTGWQTVSFSYTMTQGTAYAVRLSTATSGGSFPWRITTGSNNNGIQPSGEADSHWARGANTAAPTNTSNNIWVVNTSYNPGGGMVARATGMPYQSFTSAATSPLLSTTNAIGQRFRFDQPDSGQSFLSGIDLKLSLSSPPSTPLTVHLLDSAGNILTTGNLSLTGLSNGIHTVNFNDTIQLTDGAYYYFAAYVNASGSSSAAILSGGLMTNDSVYIAASYQGSDSYGVSWVSHSNFSAPTAIQTTDYYFGLNLDSVPEPGAMLLTMAGFAVTLLPRRRKRANG